MSIGLLILRLVVGLALAAHGTQKLFGWFGGYGLSGTAGFLEQLGFVPGRRNALFAGLAETAGGLLLALGLATPVAAAMLIAVMVVAAVSAHLKHGFFAHNQGYEYTLVLATAALTAIVRSAVRPTAISSGGEVSGIVRRVTTNGCGRRRCQRSKVSARRSPVA